MILHIVVHPQDKISLRIVQTRHDRIMLSEIFRQINAFHIRIFLRKFMDGTPGIVSGVIVYQHELTFIIVHPFELFYGQLHYFSDGFL